MPINGFLYAQLCYGYVNNDQRFRTALAFVVPITRSQVTGDLLVLSALTFSKLL